MQPYKVEIFLKNMSPFCFSIVDIDVKRNYSFSHGCSFSYYENGVIPMDR